MLNIEQIVLVNRTELFRGTIQGMCLSTVNHKHSNMETVNNVRNNTTSHTLYVHIYVTSRIMLITYPLPAQFQTSLIQNKTSSFRGSLFEI